MNIMNTMNTMNTILVAGLFSGLWDGIKNVGKFMYNNIPGVRVTADIFKNGYDVIAGNKSLGDAISNTFNGFIESSPTHGIVRQVANLFGWKPGGGEQNPVLHALYKAAYWAFTHLINAINFYNGNKPLETAQGQVDLWQVTKNCYEALVGVTIPIATIFFIVAIYKSVISKPAEEQAKQFLLDALRFILILIVAAHLIQILEIVMNISNGMTSVLVQKNNMGNTSEMAKIGGAFSYEQSDVYNGINGLESPGISDLLDGDLLQFCEKIFAYIVYFLGGLVTLVVFIYSGITIVKVCFQRIIKPLIMLPFASVVLAIGSCGGEGDRMLWNYGKNFLGYCMSGAFIVVAIRLGMAIGSSNILRLTFGDGGHPIVTSIGAIISLNLAALITTGLVSSMESFMSKIFG